VFSGLDFWDGNRSPSCRPWRGTRGCPNGKPQPRAPRPCRVRSRSYATASSVPASSVQRDTSPLDAKICRTRETYAGLGSSGRRARSGLKGWAINRFLRGSRRYADDRGGGGNDDVHHGLRDNRHQSRRRGGSTAPGLAAHLAEAAGDRIRREERLRNVTQAEERQGGHDENRKRFHRVGSRTGTHHLAGYARWDGDATARRFTGTARRSGLAPPAESSASQCVSYEL